MNIDLWNVVADSNRQPPPDGEPEGWPWKTVTGSFREIMASFARYYQDAEWTNPCGSAVVSRSDVNVVKVAGLDLTGVFAPDQRVRMTTGIMGGEVDELIESVVLASGDTLVTVASDNAPLGCSGLLLHSFRGWGSTGFRTVGSGVGDVTQVVESDTVPLYYSAIERPFTKATDTTLNAGLSIVDLGSPGVNYLPLDSIFPLGSPNGTREIWLDISLAMQTEADIGAGSVDHVTFYVYLGTPSFLLGTQMLKLSFVEDPFQTDENRFMLVIPALSIGIPDAGACVSLWATSDHATKIIGSGSSPTFFTTACLRIFPN